MPQERFAGPAWEEDDGSEGNRMARVTRIRSVLFVLVGFSASLPGCAPTQMIGLDVGPTPLVLFVDGEPLEELPPAVELTANRNHTLFFQREGYRSQLIIVRTTERDGEARLEPARIELRLKRVADTTPSVSVELDESPEKP